MITEGPTTKRATKTVSHHADLVIVGGGLAGTCGAITAAREGLKVVLVQDRPVLGGNASSEVRLWVLGATSHMGNNNRWALEGGVIHEIFEENLFRNRHGNALIVDTILLEKVLAEPNIELLLNTAAYQVEKDSDDRITMVRGFCSQNSTTYDLHAPLFCDASGDGIIGFLSGAAFRMGAESGEEFGEGFAPDESYGQLLGHSIYFSTKDVGEPIKFVAPSYALKDLGNITQHRKISSNMQGCNFWWIEYGGRLDTVHETETIKWELWKVVYGIWDHIKNSGEFPEAENLTLEWVGHVPGKRESRRFEGDTILKQQDVIEQKNFEDTVAHGGWSLDLHPADGVYAEQAACNQWHAKGVYGIPYRSYYSRNIPNLFLAGRIISASHVAFGSSRVMATCAVGGQAVAVAAAICREHNCLPREVGSGKLLAELQRRLERSGQFLPDVEVDDPTDLALLAKVKASSSLALGQLPPGVDQVRLDDGWAMLLPLSQGVQPTFGFDVEADQAGTLRIELQRSLKPGNFTPDELLEVVEIPLPKGSSTPKVEFQRSIERGGYHLVILRKNPSIKVRLSDSRLTGILALSNAFNKAVATSAVQQPPEGSGIECFEFWLPKRRPEGRNLAIRIDPPIDTFGPENAISGPPRPTESVNAWVADPGDSKPELSLSWPKPVTISRVLVEFDPDWDHPVETVLMTHPEEVSPFMVRDFDLLDGDGRVLAERRDNHGARCMIDLPVATTTSSLHLRIHATQGTPAAVFRLRVF